MPILFATILSFQGSTHRNEVESDIMQIEKSEKTDITGKLKDIFKIITRMHHVVREDLLKYLRSVEQD